MTAFDSPNRASSSEDPVEEVNAFLLEQWSPELTVGEWWERLGLAGWSAPSLPRTAYGRGLSRPDAVRAQDAIDAFGALGAPGGLGLLLAAPTIAAHGTEEQIEQHVRGIVTGRVAWCQLFSEPAAGSDLAGLQAKAAKDGDEWVVNGQKVWTSAGLVADMGMLIARSNPDVPKHQGITWFAFDMRQPGVEVRPLREMTGRALFNEVFLTDARVADGAVIGGLHNGWAVANSTLMFERVGLGAGGGNASGGTATPGTVAGHLDRRAGDFVGEPPSRRRSPLQSRGGVANPGALMGGAFQLLRELATANGTSEDPLIRQDLARLHTLAELGRLTNLRSKAVKDAGGDEIPGLGNIAKLSMSDMVRLTRDLGLRIVGPYGTLHAYPHQDRASLDAAADNPFLGLVTEIALFAQAPPIYGGTDQIQRNIIGERVLGLPKEPNNDRVVAFKDLPKNA